MRSGGIVPVFLFARQNRQTKWTVEDACPYNSRHTFPLSKNGRFVNRPYGLHCLSLDISKGQIRNLPSQIIFTLRSNISHRDRGISQKHRFYFTLPRATFHRAIGATPGAQIFSTIPLMHLTASVNAASVDSNL